MSNSTTPTPIPSSQIQFGTQPPYTTSPNTWPGVLIGSSTPTPAVPPIEGVYFVYGYDSSDYPIAMFAHATELAGYLEREGMHGKSVTWWPFDTPRWDDVKAGAS